MKAFYQEPETEIINFDTQDIIRTSEPSGGEHESGGEIDDLSLD